MEELQVYLPFWREKINAVDIALGISKAFGDKR
jgi:hypothetical protein